MLLRIWIEIKRLDVMSETEPQTKKEKKSGHDRVIVDNSGVEKACVSSKKSVSKEQ